MRGMHVSLLALRCWANALTWILACYGAWGWFTDPQLGLLERLLCAAIALVAQQLLNGAGALAAMAATKKVPLRLGVAVALIIVLGGVCGYGIDHALGRQAAAREAASTAAREQQRIRLDEQIHASTQERLIAERAVRAISPNLPTRRIRALQAPLESAVERADARIAQLERDRAALAAPVEHHRDASGVALATLFWLLAYVEPLYYFLLLSREAEPGVPAVAGRRPRTELGQVGPLSGQWPNLSRSFLARIAVAVGLTTAPAAHATESGDTGSWATAAPTTLSDQEATSGEAEDERNSDRQRLGDQFLPQMLELQANGVSMRRIALALGGVVSKSTVQRTLARHASVTAADVTA